MDAIGSHTNTSKGSMAILHRSNHAETVMLGHGDGLSTHLGAGDTYETRTAWGAMQVC